MDALNDNENQDDIFQNSILFQNQVRTRKKVKYYPYLTLLRPLLPPIRPHLPQRHQKPY